MGRRESSAGILLDSLPSPYRKPNQAITYFIDGDCWICTSHKPSSTGYPRIRINKQLFNLSRWICLLLNGPGENNDCVMHTCDNRMCINPKHLKMGSYHDNNQDMHDKGRGYRGGSPTPPPPRLGEDNNLAKLTESEVRFIRWAAQYSTHQEIANVFKVDRTNIGYIVNRRTWKHVA